MKMVDAEAKMVFEAANGATIEMEVWRYWGYDHTAVTATADTEEKVYAAIDEVLDTYQCDPKAYEDMTTKHVSGNNAHALTCIYVLKEKFF